MDKALQQTEEVVTEGISSLLDFSLNWDQALLIVAQMLMAALIGAIIAYHPLRDRDFKKEKKRRRVEQSQILITIAGALMVVVIGGSLARAFGLVGLGSFIRFRTPVKNPVDAAVMFLLIALGMACGLGHYSIAGLGTVFLWSAIAVFHLLHKRQGIKREGSSGEADDDDDDEESEPGNDAGDGKKKKKKKKKKEYDDDDDD